MTFNCANIETKRIEIERLRLWNKNVLVLNSCWHLLKSLNISKTRTWNKSFILLLTNMVHTRLIFTHVVLNSLSLLVSFADFEFHSRSVFYISIFLSNIHSEYFLSQYVRMLIFYNDLWNYKNNVVSSLVSKKNYFPLFSAFHILFNITCPNVSLSN